MCTYGREPVSNDIQAEILSSVQKYRVNQSEGIVSNRRILPQVSAADPGDSPGNENRSGGRHYLQAGQEYCILLYSEKQEGYLPNIGYIGQQLDLWLASMNIGSLWFGIGKTEVRSESGLDFVIMPAIAKVEETAFRKDMFKSKRKPLEEIWTHEHYQDIAQIARFAPSACNTQPWIVASGEQELKVYALLLK